MLLGSVFRRESGNGVLRRTGNSEGTGGYAWQGYALTKGHIVDTVREDFIVSVPRRNIYKGIVRVHACTNVN